MLPGVRMPAGPRSRPPPRPCPPAAALLHKAPGACISRSGVRSPEKRPRPRSCAAGWDPRPEPVSRRGVPWVLQGGHHTAGAVPKRGGVTPQQRE